MSQFFSRVLLYTIYERSFQARIIRVGPPRRISDAVSELPHFLLIVIRRESSSSRKTQRNGRATSRLDYPRHGRPKQEYAVSQSELGAVVLVLLNEVS